MNIEALYILTIAKTKAHAEAPDDNFSYARHVEIGDLNRKFVELVGRLARKLGYEMEAPWRFKKKTTDGYKVLDLKVVLPPNTPPTAILHALEENGEDMLVANLYYQFNEAQWLELGRQDLLERDINHKAMMLQAERNAARVISEWRTEYRDEVVLLTGDAIRANELLNNYRDVGGQDPIEQAKSDVRKGVKGTPIVDASQGWLKIGLYTTAEQLELSL